MPQERFEGEEEAVIRPVGPDELRLVLHDLTRDECEEERAKRELPDDHVTAEAIAESLDMSIDDVHEAIARVRRKEVREHVSRVLSELEEPTHRVERAGHDKKDPLIHHYGWRREQVFSSILDKLSRPKKEPRQKNSEPESFATKVFLFFFAAAFAALAVYVVLQILQMT